MESELVKKRKKRLEIHLQELIQQPIREFQQTYGIKILAIDFELRDVSTKAQKLQTINKINIIT